MTSIALIIASSLMFMGNSGTPFSPTLPDTIQVQYEGRADLTEGGVLEQVIVTAKGIAWDSLLVRLEIRSDSGTLLYADEWSSRNWCGGYGFSEMRQGTVEEWVRQRLARIADPEWFLPSGSHGRRFSYGGIEGLRWEVRMDFYEQLWREKYDIPIHEHLIQHRGSRQIVEEFRNQVTEEQVEALLDDVGDGPCFVYNPHWDAIYGIAWSKSKKRFALILFIG